MKKNIILIIIFIIGISLIITGIVIYKKDNNIKEEDNRKEEVITIASTIILDINPSIKIELDKDNKVINIEALNEDAKDIINKELINKDLEYTIKEITNKLIEKGYVKERLIVLVSTTGTIEEGIVENYFKQESINNNIEIEVIKQIISNSSKEKADEYGISASKASFIEKILEDNKELTFEELKDKTIEELTNINKEEPIKEEKKESIKENKPVTNTPTYTCTPPSDIKSVEWCDWNIKRPQSCEYSYPNRKDWNELEQIALQAIGNITRKGGSGTNIVYRGASYCEAIQKDFITDDYTYTVILDEVTGEILSSTKKENPKPVITKEQAMSMAKAYWNVTDDMISEIWVADDTNGSPDGPGFYFRYQVNMCTPTKHCYSVDYNASTGAYMSSREWDNIVP